MRAETAAYRAERKKWATQPRLFLRAFHIPAYDSTQEWAFSRDFASGPVVGAATEKLVCIRRAAGNPQRVDPISGTSDIGTLTVELVNVGGEILRHIADPARPLSTAIAASQAYVLKAASSDLSGGADFNRVLSLGTETASTIVVSVAASATEDSYGFTPAGDPGGSGGPTGPRTYTIEANVTVANANLFLTIQVARISSTGTVLAGPVTIGSEQGLGSTGVKTFTGSADIGAFGGTDRLRVTYRFRNNVASAQAVTIQTGTVDTEVTAPWAVLAYIEVDDAAGYPAKGHVQIESEDCTYTGRDTTTTPDRFTGITRGARGTVLAAHATGVLVRNGEQLRSGQRVTLFLGYAPLDEDDYGPGPGYVKMAIEALDSQNAGQTWTLRAADIQRFVKQSIFTSATPDAPAAIGPEHPLTIALKVLTSTGAGVNGAYDVLPSSQGAHVPNTLVNVENLEFFRDAVLPGLQMRFKEIEVDDAKSFIEQQLFRPLNLVPFISQRGRYGVRIQRTPLFARSGLVLPRAVVGTAA